MQRLLICLMALVMQNAMSFVALGASSDRAVDTRVSVDALIKELDTICQDVSAPGSAQDLALRVVDLNKEIVSAARGTDNARRQIEDYVVELGENLRNREIRGDRSRVADILVANFLLEDLIEASPGAFLIFAERLIVSDAIASSIREKTLRLIGIRFRRATFPDRENANELYLDEHLIPLFAKAAKDGNEDVRDLSLRLLLGMDTKMPLPETPLKFRTTPIGKDVGITILNDLVKDEEISPDSKRRYEEMLAYMGIGIKEYVADLSGYVASDENPAFVRAKYARDLAKFYIKMAERIESESQAEDARSSQTIRVTVGHSTTKPDNDGNSWNNNPVEW